MKAATALSNLQRLFVSPREAIKLGRHGLCRDGSARTCRHDAPACFGADRKLSQNEDFSAVNGRFFLVVCQMQLSGLHVTDTLVCEWSKEVSNAARAGRACCLLGTGLLSNGSSDIYQEQKFSAINNQSGCATVEGSVVWWGTKTKFR